MVKLSGRVRRGQTGITFLGLLFALAITSIALAGTGVLWHMESQREKEKELLFIGEEYRAAISRYYDKTPGETKQFPEKIEELLLDKRVPKPATHLRKPYRDPMKADGQWELIRQQERIIGVASTSLNKPIKIAGFRIGQETFKGAESYSEWRFTDARGNAIPLPVDANLDPADK